MALPSYSGAPIKPPTAPKPAKPYPGIAGAFVQGAANHGVPWAQQLENSPWAGHGPNTQAGWQAAGYGQPAQHPQPVQHPQPPGPPRNSATTQAPPDPRDSTYYANVAQNQFKVNNQLNSLGEQGQYATTDLQNALAKLAYQQPRAELNAEEAANRRGGLYSSVYNQQLGDIAHSYSQNQFQAQQAYDRGSAARASQTSALQESVPLFNDQQYAAAAIRASNLAAQNKALGESTAPLVPGKPAAPAHPAGASRPGHQSNSQRLAYVIAHGPAHPEPVRPGHIPAAVKTVPNKFGSRNTRGERPGGGKATTGVHQFSSTQRRA